jgi:hypothetical protein
VVEEVGPPVEDSDTQRLSQERASPEIQEPWTFDSKDPNQDLVTSPSPVQQAGPEHGDDAAERRPAADIATSRFSVPAIGDPSLDESVISKSQVLD